MSNNLFEKRSVAIELKNITKKYTVHHEKPTFVENLIRNGYREEFTALNRINIKIFQGAKVGLIGPNGAGKTTLLKIIAGITIPDEGIVKTKGRVVSLIDLEAGFHPDLTGEENIMLNGLVIGMKKGEIKKRFDEIVKFADIGQFINSPLYTYSSGMKLRLGFAIAVYSNPEILLLDETIVVGDESFREKINRKLEQLFNQKITIIVVSHWMDLIKSNTDSTLVLMDKKIVNEGPSEDMISWYLDTLS